MILQVRVSQSTLVDLFSFIFWKNLKTQKRHFEINWPLKNSYACKINFRSNICITFIIKKTSLRTHSGSTGFVCFSSLTLEPLLCSSFSTSALPHWSPFFTLYVLCCVVIERTEKNCNCHLLCFVVQRICLDYKNLQ